MHIIMWGDGCRLITAKEVLFYGYTNLINSANNPANRSDLEGLKAWFVHTQMQEYEEQKIALKGGGNLARKNK